MNSTKVIGGIVFQKILLPKDTTVVTVFSPKHSEGTRRSFSDSAGYDNQREQLSAELDEATGNRRHQGDVR
jgi:hypothetical protein